MRYVAALPAMFKRHGKSVHLRADTTCGQEFSLAVQRVATLKTVELS